MTINRTDASLGGQTTQVAPIGVSGNVTVVRNPGTAYVDPFSYNPDTRFRYYSGDEFTPGSQSPQDIMGLQQALVDAGYLGKYIAGSWDDASAAAYNEALGVANRSGITVDEVLQRGAAAGGRGGGGGSAPKLPSPDDVKALLNETAYKQIGKNLDDTALQAGVQAFYAAYKPAGQYQAPDAQTIADQYLTSTAPQEVQAHQATTVYATLSKMLGGI